MNKRTDLRTGDTYHHADMHERARQRKLVDRIDAMDLETILRHNRFAPIGDELLVGEVGDYFMRRFATLRHVAGPEEFTAISKRVGWDQPTKETPHGREI